MTVNGAIPLNLIERRYFFHLNVYLFNFKNKKSISLKSEKLKHWEQQQQKTKWLKIIRYKNTV